MVYLGTGVSAAMKGFGTTLLKMYGTERLSDYTTEYLGFSTDVCTVPAFHQVLM